MIRMGRLIYLQNANIFTNTHGVRITHYVANYSQKKNFGLGLVFKKIPHL